MSEEDAQELQVLCLLSGVFVHTMDCGPPIESQPARMQFDLKVLYGTNLVTLPVNFRCHETIVHVRGVECNRHLICVESDESDPGMPGIYHPPLNSSKVDGLSPPAWARSSFPCSFAGHHPAGSVSCCIAALRSRSHSECLLLK